MASIYDSSEMIRAFLDEVEEQLQLLEQGILTLELQGENPEVIQSLFRIAHTLKGSASTMSFQKMALLTHEMENVLDKLRNNKLGISRSVIDALLQCEDCLRMLKSDFQTNKDSIPTDITSTLGLLKQLQCQDMEKQNSENQIADKTDVVLLSKEIEKIKLAEDQETLYLSQEEISILKEASHKGTQAFLCHVKIRPESYMKVVRAFLVLNTLEEIGRVIKSEPNLNDLPDDTDLNEITYLLLSPNQAQEIENKIKNEMMELEDIQVLPYYFQESYQKGETAGILADETNKNENSQPKGKTIVHSTPQTVRVDVDRIEQIMNLVGELVIEQTRIAQVSQTLNQSYASDPAVEELLGVANHVSRVISELQENVMKTRMLPVQQLFNRFPRMVRDLAQNLNKDIDLIFEGGQTEMDRTIIEEIHDPLIHIIRNSIDHGIESPKERLHKGKKKQGIVKISAFHQENNVILTIEDDGRGIDIPKIKSSAVQKQILSQQEADNLSEDEAINLIFTSGFSTATTVSDISGRGVGMDIVRNQIDKLNGIIDVETAKDYGTKFTIKLPLTLAILSGLLVKINKDTFALPMSNVLEIVRMPVQEIQYVKGQSVAVIREKVLPLIWLHDYFRIPRNNEKKNLFLVVLGVAEKRFGLVVDQLIGNQEIVVKPLGSYVGKIEGFSGATILGDGSVACILDVVGISKMVTNRKLLAAI